MTLKQKERLKKRIQAYENLGSLFGCMLEAGFKHIFNRMGQEKGIKNPDKILYNSYKMAKWIKSIVEACNEEECLELNRRLDCYQIDKTI